MTQQTTVMYAKKPKATVAGGTPVLLATAFAPLARVILSVPSLTKDVSFVFIWLSVATPLNGGFI